MGETPRSMMSRSYTVQLRATKRQGAVLDALLGHLCELYNAALQERRDAWKTCQKHISYYDQQAELTQLRVVDAESASFPAAIQRDPLRRIQRAFDGFFRRVRAKQDPGYPRFRSQERYGSFSVDAQNFSIHGDQIAIVKIGTFRFHSRCRLNGTPRQVVIKRVGKKWRAVVSCFIGPPPGKVQVGSAIGIDLGLTTLATLSNGTEIDNPRWTKDASETVARASRNLSTKKRESRNRTKAKERLRKVHQAIQGRRRAYLHTVSAWLILNYDLIAYEKLKIPNMIRGTMAKSIMDAAWGELIWQLQYKAENAGVWMIPVNPKGTTQICSACGANVPKGLGDRQHDCPGCGVSLGRDHNAALNVLQRGLRCAGLSAGVQS